MTFNAPTCADCGAAIPSGHYLCAAHASAEIESAQAKLHDAGLAFVTVAVGDSKMIVATEPGQTPFVIKGRGTVYPATIATIAPRTCIDSKELDVLHGVGMPALGRIAGVERFLTMTQSRGAKLGLLIAEVK